MAKRADGLALLMLAALTIVFFWKVALTNLIMVGVDIFTYFYPYRAAVNEALAHGTLPLWNPYLFMGVPLLANGQAGVFYPLNWPFIGLSAPQAINYSIVLHVFLTATFFYLFARNTLHLMPWSASLAASVVALGGFAASLVEHVNQLQAATWFPLMVWCLDRAMNGSGGRRLRFMLLGGGALALQLLAGHAQVSYMSLVGLGLWSLGKFQIFVLRQAQDKNFRFQTAERSPCGIGSLRGNLNPHNGAAVLSEIKNLKYLLLMILIGIGLSAIQLLPMFELSRLSIRGGGMSFREAVAFSLPPEKLLVSLLPTYGLGEAVFSEYVAFVGMAALVLAWHGLKSARRHVPLLVLLTAGLALALGFYDPLYFVFYKLVPGFGLFRVPARWLFLFVFALAALAGLGAEAQPNISTTRVEHIRTSLASLYRSSAMKRVTLLCLLAFSALLLIVAGALEVPPWPVPLLWVMMATAGWLIYHASSHFVGARGPALTCLVLIEIFWATRWLPYNQPTAPEAYSSLRPAIAYLRAAVSDQPFRIVSYSDLGWDPGDLQDMRTMFAGQLTPDAVYQYTVAAKAKEIVAPNLALRYQLQSVDGYDGGILPLARFVGLQKLFLSAEQINPDGRLRERLREVPAVRWLDLFNVRYVIADKIFDVWVDGIYYDLGLSLRLKADDVQPRTLDVPADFEATGIGVISYLSGGASNANGAPVAELLATDSVGKLHKFIMRAGHETAESEYRTAPSAHDPARAVHTVRDRPSANEYHALFNFEAPTRLTSLQVRALQPSGDLIVHGISLVDKNTTTGKTLTLAPDGHFRLVQSGDIKIYEYVDVSPRAVVVHRAEVVVDDVQALARMSQSTFDTRSQIVLASGRALDGDLPASFAKVTTYHAEHITLTTDDEREGYLCLKDTWYPGWHAWVDGQPAVIERADTYFRAIYLSGGPHTVELRFEPESLQLGALISAVMLVLYAGAWVWSVIRSMAPRAR